MSAAELENLLGKLLVPDNSVIKEATQQLSHVFKDLAILPELCNVLGNSQDPRIRQYAALLLRRKLAKSKIWKSLDPDICARIKETILQVLLNEPESVVRRAISQIVGTLAKHDLGDNRWPQLFEFLHKAIQSEISNDRELGMMILSIVSSSAAKQLQPHSASLFQLFSHTLDERDNRMVPFYTIQAMTHLVFEVGTEELKSFQILLPKALHVIRSLVAVDEDQACEALELFDELVECEVAVVVPHIKAIVEFCLEIAADTNLGDNIRVKAMSFISWLTRLKKKSILKYKLTRPIMNVLFPIMCTPPEDEDDVDDDQDLEECQSPGSSAGQSVANSFAQQVIDTLALHLPPEKFIPLVLQYAEPALLSEKPFDRRAAFLTLAVTAEGCADFITNRHLKSFVECVCSGMADNHPAVRSAALFALGQFCEHLQPEISSYAASILPLLFEYVTQVTQRPEQKTALDKTYFALENFCENLGEEIVTYLPALMQHVLSVLTNESSSVHMKELAISCIGATANAAKGGMMPYFGDVMGHIKNYLTVGELEDTVPLQLQAIDTLGVLVRTLGAEHFLPLCPECVEMGLKLLDIHMDPDLRRCVYGLFAAVSSIQEFSLQLYLPRILPHLMEAIKSNDGIVAHYAEEDNKIFQFFDEDDVDEDEDDDDNIQGYSVENAYMEEKEDACSALGELSINSGTHFMPYLQESFQTVFPLIEHSSSDVKKEAVTCVGQLCCSTQRAIQETQSQETVQVLDVLLKITVPKFLAVVKTETDRMVAMTTLEALKHVITNSQPVPVLDYVEPIVQCVREVLLLKTACQDPDEEEEDDQQAEYDAMLIENAGEIIPSLAKAIGGQTFAPYFAGLLPELLKRMKKNSTDAERSFACGILAETMQSLDSYCAPFVQYLYPVFGSALKDDEDEVRNNAVFGLGILASCAHETMSIHYPELLKCFFEMLPKESNKSVVDNICGAVCKMVMANQEMVPVDQILPVVIQCLPIKEDFEENSSVFGCLAQLYQLQHPQVLKSRPQLLHIFSQVLGTEQIKQDAQHVIMQMVQNIYENDSNLFQQVLASMPLENVQKLQACLPDLSR